MRDRVQERALRGVESKRRVVQNDKKAEEKEKEQTLDGGEERPRKRRRLAEDGESVGVYGAKPARKPANGAGPSRIPTKRPIEAVSIARAAFPQASKPTSRHVTSKVTPRATRRSHQLPTPPTTGPNSKSAASPASRHVTNN